MNEEAQNPVLDRWNGLDAEAAAGEILPCNGSATWAALVAYNRPVHRAQDLFTLSDSVWQSLPEEDWQQAFDSHPRIGEAGAKHATSKSLEWSKSEQSTAAPDATTLTELAEGNAAYERKFGRIFIICATGKSASEMLVQLERRLQNDPQTELHEAAEQQRQITQLRLRKWLGLPLENGKAG